MFHLLANKTTLVGTIRKNKRDLPQAAKSTTHRKKKDSLHFYADDLTLCSFWDKGSSPVLLLSTMHASQENRSEEKPDIVQFYNQTKSGVDNLDKLVRSFRSQRKCRRWPYGIFFTLCDVAVITACKMWNKDDHYLFKRELSYELALPLIHRRINILGL